MLSRPPVIVVATFSSVGIRRIIRILTVTYLHIQMMYFATAMKVSSRRKDKFIVGEHTLHFPVPRSLSHRGGVYPFPFGSHSPEPHARPRVSPRFPRRPPTDRVLSSLARNGLTGFIYFIKLLVKIEISFVLSK